MPRPGVLGCTPSSLQAGRRRLDKKVHNLSPNKPMQRAGTDKLLGRGRLSAVHEQVTSARVLNRQRAVADGGRWATVFL
jgi:hypothetical protein